MPELTTPTPADNGGTLQPTPTGQPPVPQAPATTPAAAAPEPYRAFATQGDLDGFVQERVKRAERSALKKLATELGFEDSDELRDALQPLRRGRPGAGSQTPPTTPATPAAANTPAAPSNDAARLMMALQVGAKLNLPAALIARLQGDTLEAMEADAQTLVGLMGSGTRGPGIPPVPGGNPPVTFTRQQMQDAKFVREHAAEIRQAAVEGRIVRS